MSSSERPAPLSSEDRQVQALERIADELRGLRSDLKASNTSIINVLARIR